MSEKVARSEGYTDMAGERVLVIDDSPTITKVVQLVLTKAGFTVDTAADGEAGLAQVRAERPDVILLDFVMPKMNGYQVCRELNADPELRDIPVILMSAKGDQVGERFIKVMGIVDYITKPFSPEAITAVVQHTIGKYPFTREPDAAPRSAGEDLGISDEAERAGARRTALAQLRTSITQALAGTSGVPEVIRALEAIDDDTLTHVLAGIDLSLFGDAPGLRGDLRVIPLVDLLQLLDAQEQAGTLTLERSAARVDERSAGSAGGEDARSVSINLYFRRGRIDQAIATGVADELSLGRFVVDAGLMQRADLDAFLASRTGPPALLGQQLIARGVITETDLEACLTRQSSELIFETLRWRHGRFRFAAGAEAPPHVTDASLGLDVQAVLMEGFRRVDEWHLIERAIDNFDVVLLRNEDAIAQMGRGRLTRDELAILELVNGKHTVQEIIRRSRMRSFEVTKMLYRLLSIKLVRRRVLPVAVST